MNCAACLNVCPLAPAPEARSSHLSDSPGVCISDKPLGAAGQEGPWLTLCKGWFLPCADEWAQPYCPQVWDMELAALHQGRKLGQVSGALTPFCTWALGLAHVTCESVRYFSVFEGVCVLACLFPVSVCLPPCDGHLGTSVSLVQLSLSSCPRGAHSTPAPVYAMHGFMLCYLSVSAHACRRARAPGQTHSNIHSFQLLPFHSKENFNLKLFHCTAQSPRDE